MLSLEYSHEDKVKSLASLTKCVVILYMLLRTVYILILYPFINGWEIYTYICNIFYTVYIYDKNVFRCRYNSIRKREFVYDKVVDFMGL